MPHPRPAPLLAGALALWAAGIAVNRSLRDVTGSSMEPALSPGDRLVVRPVGPVLPRRGDVVVLRDPREPERRTIKRVVGVPGEHVRLRAGRLAIDGVVHIEPHAHRRCGDDDRTVPPHHVYVLGDNRARSTDSRTYGPVPLELVEAVVLGTVRPLRATVRSEPVPLAGTRHGRTATTSSSGSSSATPDPA